MTGSQCSMLYLDPGPWCPYSAFNQRCLAFTLLCRWFLSKMFGRIVTTGRVSLTSGCLSYLIDSGFETKCLRCLTSLKGHRSAFNVNVNVNVQTWVCQSKQRHVWMEREVENICTSLKLEGIPIHRMETLAHNRSVHQRHYLVRSGIEPWYLEFHDSAAEEWHYMFVSIVKHRLVEVSISSAPMTLQRSAKKNRCRATTFSAREHSRSSRLNTVRFIRCRTWLKGIFE